MDLAEKGQNHRTRTSNAANQQATFEEAITQTGQGRFHNVLSLVMGLSLIAVDFEMFGISLYLPAARCDLRLDTQQQGIINAACFIGMIFSSHLWGYLADTSGRRFVLILTFLLDCSCSIFFSFANNFGLLVFGRFLNGFFICGPAAVTYAFLSEFHSEKTRSRIIVWVSVGMAIGFVLLPGLAWLVMPLQLNVQLPWTTFNSWRLFMILCTTPGLITVLALIFYFPESPKYLLANGQHDKAIEVLRVIYSQNTGDYPENFPVRNLYMDDLERRASLLTSELPAIIPNTKSLLSMVKAIAQKMWRQTAPLFVSPLLSTTIITCILEFGIFLCDNGILLWLPELFIRMADAGPDMSVCEAMTTIVSPEESLQDTCESPLDHEVFFNSAMVGVTSVVAFILVGFIVTVLGSKCTLVGSLMLTGVSGLAMYWARSSLQLLILSCLYTSLSGICISVVSSIIVDAFPTQMRAMALCLAFMMARLGTVGGSLVIGLLLDFNCGAVFFTFGGAAIAIGFVSIFVPKPIREK